MVIFLYNLLCSLYDWWYSSKKRGWNNDFASFHASSTLPSITVPDNLPMVTPYNLLKLFCIVSFSYYMLFFHMWIFWSHIESRKLQWSRFRKLQLQPWMAQFLLLSILIMHLQNIFHKNYSINANKFIKYWFK